MHYVWRPTQAFQDLLGRLSHRWTGAKQQEPLRILRGENGQSEGIPVAVALAEKLAIQKVVRELDATRNRKRRELFEAQDRVDNQREELIATIEKRLQQQSSLISIFIVRWSLA